MTSRGGWWVDAHDDEVNLSVQDAFSGKFAQIFLTEEDLEEIIDALYEARARLEIRQMGADDE